MYSGGVFISAGFYPRHEQPRAIIQSTYVQNRRSDRPKDQSGGSENHPSPLTQSLIEIGNKIVRVFEPDR